MIAAWSLQIVVRSIQSVQVSVAIDVSRRIDVGGMQLLIVDNAFGRDQVADVHRFVRDLPYRLNDFDTDATAYARHLRAELPVSLAETTPVFRDCVQIAKTLLARAPLRLNRVHANMMLHGDLQHPHPDLADSVTAIYYANLEWQDVWQGETIFYDAAGEPLHAVAPRPGRLAIFHANLRHRAGVPSRACFEPRLSVAFKFAPP